MKDAALHRWRELDIYTMRQSNAKACDTMIATHAFSYMCLLGPATTPLDAVVVIGQIKYDITGTLERLDD